MILKEKPVVAGSEKIDGKDSLVIEAADEDGQKYRAWIWKEYGFTIRVEAITPQGKVVVEWKNIEFVDNADFVEPLERGVNVAAEQTGVELSAHAGGARAVQQVHSLAAH